MRKVVLSLVLAGALMLGSGEQAAADSYEGPTCVGEFARSKAGAMGTWAGKRPGDSDRAAGYGDNLGELMGEAGSTHDCERLYQQGDDVE